MKVLILIHPNFYSCKEFENNLVLKVLYEVCVVVFILTVENVNKSSTEYVRYIHFIHKDAAPLPIVLSCYRPVDRF